MSVVSNKTSVVSNKTNTRLKGASTTKAIIMEDMLAIKKANSDLTDGIMDENEQTDQL